MLGAGGVPEIWNMRSRYSFCAFSVWFFSLLAGREKVKVCRFRVWDDGELEGSVGPPLGGLRRQ